MINVKIYDCGDLVIRNIGEELIKENHKNIYFHFISELDLGENGYVIVNDKNNKVNSNSNVIVLTEEKDEDGIFLYQAKAKIKAEILKMVGHEEKELHMEIIAAICPYNLWTATISNHFLAKEIVDEGKKVCMLSFNIDFPFKCIGWNTSNKGLLKALYYYNNQEKFNLGIISHNTTEKYDYIEMDIRGEELYEITDVFIKNLMKFLETQNYEYLVLDYGVLYWNIREIEDYLYYIQIEGSLFNREMDKSCISTIKNNEVDVIELGELNKIISTKNGQVIFNKDSEELILWKKSLRKKLLEN